VQGAGPAFVVRRKDTADTIYRIDTPTAFTAEYSGMGIDQLATDGGTTVARAGTQVLLRSAIGVWSALPALPCTPTTVAVVDNLLASCRNTNGGVYEYAGGSWTRIFDSPDVVAMAAAPDKTLVVMLVDGAAVRLPGMQTFDSIGGPTGLVTQLVAASADEIYVDVIGDNFLHRWDGARWSPLAFPPGDAFVVTRDEIVSVAPDASGTTIFARLFVLLRGLD
jgi:hypothetical protein